ncbi:MAG: hypothetical protein A2Y33_01775 [Spirochaetes bacterium GWF1_51_8]|nr:MAG: hypothetical protein A2Y33_01775 [Spirochaetes bacterium GWF1_51_8]
MNRVYLGVKIFFFVVLIVFVVNIFVYEAIGDGKALAESNPISAGVASVYSGIKEFILTDPYFSETVAKVQKFQSSLKEIFHIRIATLEGYASTQRFYDQIFSYVLSRELTEIGDITHEYFSPFADFKDLIIIDKKMNVIYKSGSESFSVEFYNYTNNIYAKNFNNLYGLVLQGKDPVLDINFQIIALFDFTAISGEVIGQPLPAFVYIGDTLLRNDLFSIDDFRLYKDTLQNNDEIHSGLNILKKIPIAVEGNSLGYAGILYPARSFVSYLLVILKTLLFFGLGLLVFIIDRRVMRYLKSNASRLKRLDGKLVVDIPQSPKMSEDEETDEDTKTEKNLQWIEHYIGQSEHEK